MKQENENRFSELIGQLIRRLSLLNRDQMVCYGVTLSQCYVLETLFQKGKRTMNELSQEQGVTVSTMTRIVDVLVRDDIVRRENDPKDRRIVCIELTEKGEDLATKLEVCTQEFMSKILENIPEEKREQVIESMSLLDKAVEAFNFSCCTVQGTWRKKA